ncbi:ATP-binding cassette domain-containing protein [Candidatus Poribacteria bacterium]|nr:ATP-binding cassette domain-containing protein [Candidatus Poribacteria bacterium]
MHYTNQPGYPIVKLNDITLQIDGKRLFEHTFWEIKSDQHWAVIGKNGSGKSTIVSALCRDVHLVHGQILYFWGDSDDEDNRPRSFFYRNEIMKISPDVHRKLMHRQARYHQARWHSTEGEGSPTVADFLSENSKEKRQQVIDLLQINYLLQRKILHLSNGEARKALIAQALIQSPKLLILDDAFCGLDNQSRSALRNAIDNLLEQDSVRLVLVTSRLEEIPPGITHVICVADNQIVAQGPKEKILSGQFAQELFSAPEDIPKEPLFQAPADCRENAILVEMKDISVSYGGVNILQDINWRMRAGEHWAIIGPNGAGKSTLLSLICADNPQAYANEISLFGKKRGSGESIWDVKRKIGWLSPEIQVYYPWNTTCHEVVCSGFFDTMGLHRKPSAEQVNAADRWMMKLGIWEFAGRRFGEVSRGEQRLVLLARAVVKNPILLILDEPCQGLDGSHRAAIIELIDDLCSRTPVSLIYITHHFDEMPKAITHVMKLREGRIEEICFRRSPNFGGEAQGDLEGRLKIE